MRIKLPIFVCLILFVGIVVVSLTHMFLNPLPREYYIFQDIEECEKLIPVDLAAVDFERKNMPTNDKDLSNLPYNQFFGAKMKSDALEYEIFAYEFEDADSALKYYVNITGQNSYEKKLPLDGQEDSFLLSTVKGLLSYRMIVVAQNRAYKLIAPPKYADEINKLLADIFSQKLP